MHVVNHTPELGQLMLLTVKSTRMNDHLMEMIGQIKPAGFSLFRALNVESLVQVRQFTAALQTAAKFHAIAPFLIAADQEGGQLMAVAPGVTPLPGNMALGAVNDLSLAFRAGQVLGRELAAVGVNVNYAPSADVNINPKNPVIGTRSFGEDPQKVGALVAAQIRGMQSVGVAATVKHFPGHGDTASDSHHGVPQVPHDLSRLTTVEFPPFQAAIDADVQLVMSCHLSLPALTGQTDLPASISETVIKGLLREQLSFKGVVVTDALDMHAIRQGEALGLETLAALCAGSDLLLTMSDPVDRERIYRTLNQAFNRGLLKRETVQSSLARIYGLKQWVRTHFKQPDLTVINSAEHQAVAREIAERSITLIHDREKQLPLDLAAREKVLVLLPKPEDLTPADTSSYETPSLVKWWGGTETEINEVIYPMSLEETMIGDLVKEGSQSDRIIVGTINAFDQPRQQKLLQALAALGKPLILAALRMPYDVSVFPQAGTALCTYSVLPPSMQALADILAGEISPTGHLPVSIQE